jgi:Rps23 Pro-64 3,4-dihydroxylase Tpa1-like proline 4-hydroxylase
MALVFYRIQEIPKMTATKLPYVTDPDYLANIAEKYAEQYQTAKPFPHVVIDDFLPPEILETILEEYPAPDEIEWKKFGNKSENKLASTSELQMGAMTRFLLYQLNSETFINFLEKLTGIEGLIPDPHFVGGGLHQIKPGGFLKVHVDFNKHNRLKLDRRLNLLLYLNKDWQEDYGGHLQLWDQEMTVCEAKILPIFNRCVVFSTTDFSYHGHPDPLTCPEDRTRRSLALYYYSNGRPAEEVKDGDHSTIFRERPGEDLQEDPTASKQTVKTLIKKFIPPIVTDLISKS